MDTRALADASAEAAYAAQPRGRPLRCCERAGVVAELGQRRSGLGKRVGQLVVAARHVGGGDDLVVGRRLEGDRTRGIAVGRSPWSRRPGRSWSRPDAVRRQPGAARLSLSARSARWPSAPSTRRTCRGSAPGCRPRGAARALARRSRRPPAAATHAARHGAGDLGDRALVRTQRPLDARLQGVDLVRGPLRRHAGVRRGLAVRGLRPRRPAPGQRSAAGRRRAPALRHADDASPVLRRRRLVPWLDRLGRQRVTRRAVMISHIESGR